MPPAPCSWVELEGDSAAAVGGVRVPLAPPPPRPQVLGGARTATVAPRVAGVLRPRPLPWPLPWPLPLALPGISGKEKLFLKMLLTALSASC